MSKKDINQIVAADYGRYVDLKNRAKMDVRGDVVLRKDKRDGRKRIANLPLSLAGKQDVLTLKVVTDIVQGSRMSVLLFDRDFMGEDPCFRFDADGPLHTNPFEEGVPLKCRRITTPHFHMFDSKGRETAYKTQELQGNEKSIMASRTLILGHFCSEENVLVEAGGGKVCYEELLVPESQPLADPLQGVPFDE